MHASNVLISGSSSLLLLAHSPLLPSFLPLPLPALLPLTPYSTTDLIARHALDNPCSLYALNILIDTTLGVLVLFGFLKLSTRLMLRVDPSYKTGDYGNPFDKGVWARQVSPLSERRGREYFLTESEDRRRCMWRVFLR